MHEKGMTNATQRQDKCLKRHEKCKMKARQNYENAWAMHKKPQEKQEHAKKTMENTVKCRRIHNKAGKCNINTWKGMGNAWQCKKNAWTMQEKTGKGITKTQKGQENARQMQETCMKRHAQFQDNIAHMQDIARIMQKAWQFIRNAWKKHKNTEEMQEQARQMQETGRKRHEKYITRQAKKHEHTWNMIERCMRKVWRIIENARTCRRHAGTLHEQLSKVGEIIRKTLKKYETCMEIHDNAGEVHETNMNNYKKAWERHEKGRKMHYKSKRNKKTCEIQENAAGKGRTNHGKTIKNIRNAWEYRWQSCLTYGNAGEVMCMHERGMTNARTWRNRHDKCMNDRRKAEQLQEHT